MAVITGGYSDTVNQRYRYTQISIQTSDKIEMYMAWNFPKESVLIKRNHAQVFPDL